MLLTPTQQVKRFLSDTRGIERLFMSVVPNVNSRTFERVCSEQLTIAIQVATLKGWRRFKIHESISLSHLTEDLNFLRRVANVSEEGLVQLEQHALNTSLTVSKKIKQEFDQRIEKIVLGGALSGQSSEEIASRIDGNFITRRAVRDQINIAYRVGTESALRDVNVLAQQYVAVLDDRVRPTHLARHGVIRPKNDPWWTFNTPPIEVNCRCSIVYHFFDPPAFTDVPPDVIGVTEPDEQGNIEVVKADDLRAKQRISSIPPNAFNIDFKSLAALE